MVLQSERKDADVSVVSVRSRYVPESEGFSADNGTDLLNQITVK